MAVGPDEVRRIAALARLDVAGDEVERLAGEMTDILGHIDALAGVEEIDGGAARVERRSSAPRASAGDASYAGDRVDSGGAGGGGATPLRPDEPGGDPLAAPPSAFAPGFEGGLFRVPGAEPGTDSKSTEGPG